MGQGQDEGAEVQYRNGVVAGCCIRLAEESPFPDDAALVNEGFEGNAWFSSVNAAD